jgi:cytoskeletal protein RodZ
MEQFGDALRIERERRQVSLESICEVTKVSVRHLEALEAGRYADLPGGVFRKGILRSYLKAVGLEESGWVEQFENAIRTVAPENEAEGWTEFAENVRRNRAGSGGSGIDSRWLGVAVMILVLAALGWTVWKFVFHGRLFL